MPLLEANCFFGVFDLHDGDGKRGDLVFGEVEVFHFGRAFNIDTRLFEYFSFSFEQTPLASIVFAVMVAQNIGVRGSKGLGLSKGNGGEEECC